MNIHLVLVFFAYMETVSVTHLTMRVIHDLLKHKNLLRYFIILGPSFAVLVGMNSLLSAEDKPYIVPFTKSRASLKFADDFETVRYRRNQFRILAQRYKELEEEGNISRSANEFEEVIEEDVKVPIVVNQQQQHKNNKGHSDQLCMPKSDIVFVKTHKCSSSTIQNFLMRYAQKKDLTMVIPKTGYRAGKITGFVANSVADTFWWKAKLKPNIFMLHTVYNGREVAKLFGDSQPFYFSILRDPVSLFVSYWDYYNIKQFRPYKDWTLNKFANYSKKPNHVVLGGASMKDTILFDFGMNFKDFSNIPKVRQKIAEVETQFTFMMFVERFRESMVLLKHHLCWSYEDLASLRLNAIAASKKSTISPEAHEKLKAWLKGSYAFYDHFKAKFEREVEDFGAQRMTEELAKLDAVNKQAEDACKVEFVDKRKLHREDRPYGNGVLGYRVQGTDPECEWMAINEPKYIDMMRKAQEEKGLAILRAQQKNNQTAEKT